MLIVNTINKRFFFLLILFGLSNSLSTQNERNYWYFGQKAGMTFEEGYPQSISDNTLGRSIVFGIIEGPDNIICASDDEGNLMFYSDGRRFKNRLHQNMLNSPTEEYAEYYSQAAISRLPGSDDKYFVFVNIQDGLKNFLTYTIVDMSLDNGLGGIDPNNVHVRMINDVGKQMVVARHANGKDRWLIFLRRGTYYAHIITENGISGTPVTSSDEGVNYFDDTFTNYGPLVVSPDNKLIAGAYPGLNELHVLKFNDLTGKLEFIHKYTDEDETILTEPNAAVEFSPNSKVLYYSSFSKGIRQFDLIDLNNIPDPISIVSGGFFPYLKLGPDRKIYNIQNGEPYIGAIQNPNELGTNCAFDSSVLALSAVNLLDLPVFLEPKFPEGISYINICEGETTEMKFTGSFREITRIEWDFGDGNNAIGESNSHTYEASGTYTISASVYDEDTNDLLFTDTKDITIYATPNLLEPEDVYLCTEDNNIFFINTTNEVFEYIDPNIFNVSYYFSELDALLKNNDILEYIPEIGTKTIWVRAENRISPSCYDIVSFNIVTPEYITINIPTEQYLCDSRPISLSAPDGFISYSWSTGENLQNITVSNQGSYTLTVIKDFGEFTCQAEVTITVDLPDPPPIINKIKVIDWSRNHNSIKVILDRDGNYEYSVDGINFQTSNVFLNLPFKEDYKVYVRDINCQQTIESDKLFLLYHDRFFTPNGDGVNDYWRVINNFREENIEISIYNRYGKLLATLKHYDRGWDGRHNDIPMPTSDYWFRVVRQNGQVHYGHFTLKR